MNHVATKVGAMITSFDKEIAVARKSLITETTLINKHESSFPLFLIGWGSEVSSWSWKISNLINNTLQISFIKT